jgi:simple sugar transport system permease protein
MRSSSPLHRLISAPEFGPFVLLIGEIVVFAARSPAFLSPGNISNLLAFTPELGMITLGMTLLMTSGEFDLSVGSVFGFAPVMMWTFYNAHITSLELGFLIAMAMAVAVGFVNGWLVTRLKTRLLLRFYARTASVLNPQPFLISFVAIHLNYFS